MDCRYHGLYVFAFGAPFYHGTDCALIVYEPKHIPTPKSALKPHPDD